MVDSKSEATKRNGFDEDFDIKKVILISNSVPKSGSTLLFEYQNQLFQKAFASLPSDKLLGMSALDNIGGFVNLQKSNFLDIIRNPNYAIGPVVIKTHFVPTAEILDEISKNRHVFMSLAVRDPVDVFLSARDNFHKRGEFSEFESTNQGVDVINRYFSEIYSYTLSLNKKYDELGLSDFRVNPVKYEDIVGNTPLALINSLPVQLRSMISKKLLSEGSSLDRVFESFSFEDIKVNTQHRLQFGGQKRDYSSVDPNLITFLKSELRETALLFGY